MGGETEREENGVVVVQLTSSTIFWQEIGLMRNSSKEEVDRAARLFDEEIGPWLEGNCKHHFNAYDRGVWFSDQADAALFRMMFNGRYSE